MRGKRSQKPARSGSPSLRRSLVTQAPTPKTKNRGRTADLCRGVRETGFLVRNVRTRIGYQILEPFERQLLSGLTRQHHEHDPLQLFRVELVGIQRQHALDDDLTLLRRQNV